MPRPPNPAHDSPPEADPPPPAGAKDGGRRAGDKPGAGGAAGKPPEDAKTPADGQQPEDGKKAGAGQQPDEGKKPADAKKPDAKNPADGKKPLWKRPLFVLAVLVVVIAAVVAALLFLRHARHHATTDDAFIDGHASQVAAQVAGRVTRLYVRDNQAVKAGDALVDIDAADVQARVDQAQAQVLDAQARVVQAQGQVQAQRGQAAEATATVRQAQAEAANADEDLARYRRVDPDAVATQQSDAALARARTAHARVDAARSSVAAAAAQVKAAEAQVAVARAAVATATANLHALTLQVGYTHVVAPIDGRVARRAVEVGHVIAAGQPLMAVVGDDQWVTANYKETQLKHMRPGLPVTFKIDAVPDVVFTGHVESIQRATGAYFSMLPAENATGNYVKVVQRVPVKITFDHPEDSRRYAIGPGMSVKPDVHIE